MMDECTRQPSEPAHPAQASAEAKPVGREAVQRITHWHAKQIYGLLLAHPALNIMMSCRHMKDTGMVRMRLLLRHLDIIRLAYL